MKDHKRAFHDHLTCHLINPSKSEIGMISKHILDDINTTIINKMQINQWKNTSSILKWLNNLQQKESLSFICFDVCDSYPSITEKLLCKAWDFANSYWPISAHERDIIIHTKRSLLFSDNIPWEKKALNERLDVTMGSFDGAATYELVGCYILFCLTQKYGDNNSLYHDDGLSAFNKTQENWKNEERLVQTFRGNDLKITVEANLTRVKKHKKKSRTTVIAGSRILAHLKEIAMCGKLSIKQRSSLHSQKKPTSDKTFKERYRNRTCSFRNERYKNATELSKHIWSLQDRNINYKIKWRKVRQARSY